jgi:hypothetical protein
MRAVVRYLHSPDVSDLETYRPEVEDCFAFLLQIFVGSDSDEGEESFDVTVVTPAWLAKHHKPNDIVIGRHYLIVFGYSYSVLSEFISSYVSTCCGETWDEVSAELARLGKWEFEDYRPAESSAET